MIEEGSYVLLFHTPRKRWLVKVEKDKKMHTHLGVIDLASVIGLPYGSCVMSSENKPIYLLKPLVYDFVMKSERKTQIVYPKDMGYIAARTGLQSGSIVLEIGTGSGALTTFMASIVKPHGHIYTYDVREEFMDIAKRNLAKAGVEKYVTLNKKDAKEGVEITDADLAVIDLGDPWNAVESAKKALKGSAPLVSICPTINQVEKLAIALKNNNFIDIECIEIMKREIEAREGMTRPSFRMIGHTTYLVFARKASEAGYRGS